MRTFAIFLIEHVVHKLLRKNDQIFFVSFIQTPVLLKISSKNTLFCHFQPTANVTKNSILYVARVLDTPLVKLSVLKCSD